MYDGPLRERLAPWDRQHSMPSRLAVHTVDDQVLNLHTNEREHELYCDRETRNPAFPPIKNRFKWLKLVCRVEGSIVAHAATLTHAHF